MPELSTLPLASDGNLVAYYKFSNGADTTDSSSNSNTLTHVNTPTSVSGGKFDYGMDYELSSSEYSYASDSASLSPTGDMSISTWIKLEQLPSTAGSDFMIVAKWNFTSGKRSYRFSINTSNQLDCRISDTGANQTQRQTSVGVFNSEDIGNWINIVMTVDVSGSLLKTYRNGVELSMGTVSGASTSIHDNNARMAIGSQDVESTPANFFDGVIDDVALFDRLLTDEEIASIYAIGTLITLNPTKDVIYINSASPTTNFGTTIGSTGNYTLGERNDQTTQVKRILVKFDLSSIPSGSTINEVFLTFTISENKSSSTRTARIYRLKQNFVDIEATWNIYSTGNSWETAGATGATDIDTTETSSLSFGSSDTGKKTFTLTAVDIEDMITGGSFGNEGFLVKMDTESNDGYILEGENDATNPPILSIDYTEPLSSSFFVMF